MHFVWWLSKEIRVGRLDEMSSSPGSGGFVGCQSRGGNAWSMMYVELYPNLVAKRSSSPFQAKARREHVNRCRPVKPVSRGLTLSASRALPFSQTKGRIIIWRSRAYEQLHKPKKTGRSKNPSEVDLSSRSLYTKARNHARAES